MRVTFVNKYWYPHLGGVEYILRDIAEGVAARPGWSARAIVANEGRETVREFLGGVDVLRVGRAFAYASTPVALGMAAALKAETAGARPTDLFNLHFPYPWGETLFQVVDPVDASGMHPPLVVTYHSDIVRQKALGALYAPLANRLMDRADLVIATSPNMVEHSPVLSRVADKCRVVPFGLDPSQYADTPEVLARAAALRAGHTRPIVLFVGRLIYYKGADVLLRAIRDVDADLVMIGEGPLESELREIAVAAGIADRVTFLPPVSEEDLVAWYHAADVFCLPSVARSEAFGLVQMEAHASGTPVVSTTLTTGVPFVNQDGVTGFTVEPGDIDALAGALRKLTSDEELRARMGAAARERARKDFTIERMVDMTVAVFEEAAALRGRA
jgi:glycosyltransferase involved in cell wall biosynthesis